MVQHYLDAFVTAISVLTGQKEGQWQKSPEVTALLKLARPRGWSERGTGYLPYQPAGGGQAVHFAQLRKSTRLGAAMNPVGKQPPAQLLKP